MTQSDETPNDRTSGPIPPPTRYPIAPTVGADKNYHQKLFVQGCRQREIIPHVACKDGIKVAGLDGRTTRQETYTVSQRIRKRVEEIIGWIKTVGGLRRSRYRGLERTQAWGWQTCWPDKTETLN